MGDNMTATRQTNTYAEPIFEEILPNTQILLDYADALVADDEEAIARLSKLVLFDASSLKTLKEVFGADHIISSGYRTDLADKEYGHGWLKR